MPSGAACDGRVRRLKQPVADPGIPPASPWQFSLWLLVVGILIGLLAAGLILATTSQPYGAAVELLPPPTSAPVLVQVSGAVVQPGIYRLPAGSRVYQALEAAGGLSAEADAAAINSAAAIEDGMALFVPAIGQPTSPELPPAVRGITAGSPAGLININTAGVDELESLPEIGPLLAQRIIDHRQQHGPFPTIEAVQDVDGIGPGVFAVIQDLITAGP